MKNFRDTQSKIKSRTRLLYGLYLIAILVLVLLSSFFCCLLALTFGTIPNVLSILVANLVLIPAILVISSYYELSQLHKDGHVIANLLGGTPVRSTNLSDYDQQRLSNLISELSVAANCVTPALYVLTEEEGINALTTGYGEYEAVIAVTLGAVDHLSRDEMQALLAHEFSHTINGDVELNLKTTGVLHGLEALYILGHSYLTDEVDLNPVALIFLIIGYPGELLAKLIKLTINRERDYLADNSAIDLTRNPAGLLALFSKIQATSHPSSALVQHNAIALSHLFFSETGKRRSKFLPSTHPTIESRIKRLTI